MSLLKNLNQINYGNTEDVSKNRTRSGDNTTAERRPWEENKWLVYGKPLK
ncbi:MAG: hypothetical protein ABSA11_01130 [Candidatus Bathyarchaeia archaeon]